MPKKIQYCLIDITWIDKLICFFEMIKSKREDTYFHPHPFDKLKAEELGHYKGNDLYFLQTREGQLLGYGMLRGWDEGFPTPSLGIMIHPDHRGEGLGEQFMDFLHEQAEQKGAKKIRLKVYPENKGAIALYKKKGYVFFDVKDGQLPGYVKL
jgi:ribosomal-protein-alanine N-acetyltransferase